MPSVEDRAEVFPTKTSTVVVDDLKMGSCALVPRVTCVGVVVVCESSSHICEVIDNIFAAMLSPLERFIGIVDGMIALRRPTSTLPCCTWTLSSLAVGNDARSEIGCS